MKQTVFLFSCVQIVSVVLLFLMVCPYASVVAGSYDSIYHVILTSDPQKRNLADYEVYYGSPDSSNPSAAIVVDATMIYLNNSNAHLPWFEFYNVSASLRESPKGADLASDIDTSRVRLTPGQQYAHKFNIRVPQETGRYLVVMAWARHNPAASAYGYTLDEGNVRNDLGGKGYGPDAPPPSGNPPTLTVSTITATTTASPLTTTPIATATSEAVGFSFLGINVSTLQGIGGAAATVGAGLFGWYMKTRKRRLVSSYLTKVDSTYIEYSMNREDCKKRLTYMRNEIIHLLRKGKLDEPHFKLVDDRITQYLKDLEQSR